MASSMTNGEGTRPHLLTIPREIRDLIYDHLTQKSTLDWVDEFVVKQGKVAVDATIIIERAPLLSVMLTCSRIGEEYLQSTVFKQMEASLEVQILHNPRHEDDEDGADEDDDYQLSHFNAVQACRKRKALAVLECCRYLTLVVEDMGAVRERAATIGVVKKMIRMVTPSCQRLSTLRILVHEDRGWSPESGAHSRHKGAYLHTPLRTNRFFPSLRVSVPGLKLLQRAAGYRLQQYRAGKSRKMAYNSKDNAIAYRYVVKPRLNIVRDVVFLFSKEDAKPYFWGPADIIKRWPLLPAFDIDWDHNDVGILNEHLAKEMREWRDKRGPKALNWEEIDEEDEEAMRNFKPSTSLVDFIP